MNDLPEDDDSNVLDRTGSFEKNRWLLQWSSLLYLLLCFGGSPAGVRLNLSWMWSKVSTSQTTESSSQSTSLPTTYFSSSYCLMIFVLRTWRTQLLVFLSRVIAWHNIFFLFQNIKCIQAFLRQIPDMNRIEMFFYATTKHKTVIISYVSIRPIQRHFSSVITDTQAGPVRIRHSRDSWIELSSICLSSRTSLVTRRKQLSMFVLSFLVSTLSYLSFRRL